MTELTRAEGLGKAFSRPKEKKASEAESDPREDGKKFHALSDVTFSVPNGRITGLLGANGAGKTTLMRVLAGSLKPTSGRAVIDGIDVARDPMSVRRKIGFLSGTLGLYGRLTPSEIITYFGRLYGMSREELSHRIPALFDELGVTEFADRRTDRLSSGMKQRVAIARTVVHEPDIIIFDEPTTGLDVPSARGILEYIERMRIAGTSVIFSTHHMHEVDKLCDYIVLLDKGRVRFDGTVAEMKSVSGESDLNDAYVALTSEHASVPRGSPERRARGGVMKGVANAKV